MSETVWDVLGIEATTDERAIKRAYAARLKVTSPEADAAGYMKLRDAYETAKNQAAMQRYVASLQEQESTEQPDVPEAAAPIDQAPEANVIERPPASPQQRAFEELQALLAERNLDAFLQKIEAIQAAQTFATLDEQYHFIGAVACLVQEAEIEDTEWRGRLAALLGAREHENIFTHGTRYWFAYQPLLESYSALRAASARAHADDREVAGTPGYLHVYHVLTAPFDAERLSALTRSRVYHRLAENILERAKTDSTIVIPAENREWWERTAMTGQHRPAAEPVPVAASAPAPQDSSPKIPFWAIWMLLVVLVQGARMCSGSMSGTYDAEQSRRYMDGAPMILQQPTARDVLATDNKLIQRLALCDKETRGLLIAHLRISQVPDPSKSTDPNPIVRSLNDATLKPGLSLDESDPIVASLLEKCQAARLFDSNGVLKELPESELRLSQ